MFYNEKQSPKLYVKIKNLHISIFNCTINVDMVFNCLPYFLEHIHRNCNDYCRNSMLRLIQSLLANSFRLVLKGLYEQNLDKPKHRTAIRIFRVHVCMLQKTWQGSKEFTSKICMSRITVLLCSSLKIIITWSKENDRKHVNLWIN